MRVASLTVYDESASCEFLLPDFGRGVFEKLKTNSVLVVANGTTMLDSRDRIILSIASQKYASIQVYNEASEGSGGGEFDEEYGDIVTGFCADKTEEEISEILLRNISTIPLY